MRVPRVWVMALSSVAVKQEEKQEGPIKGPGQTPGSCLERLVVKSWQTSR